MKTFKPAIPLLLSSLLAMSAGCNQNEQKIQDLEKEKADLTARLTKAEEELISAQDRAAVADSSAENLKGQLETAKAAAESAASDLAAAAAKAATAEKALADLQVAYDKMVADAKTASDKMMADAKRASGQAAAELGKLRKQVADLTAALQAAKQPQGDPLPSNP
ncbi:MAG: hypothetical protein O7D91_06390 [Planctomycetota bacterium]|nr:hypothetical protein [Planctomycetota bacterium]